MVQVAASLPRHPDGHIDFGTWLTRVTKDYPAPAQETLHAALTFAEIHAEDHATFYGQPCLEQALECLEILAEQHADSTTLLAALFECAIPPAQLEMSDISEAFGDDVAALLKHIQKLRAIDTLHLQTNQNSHLQIDNLRKMLLSMVSDVRSVLFILAKRVCIMRGTKMLSHDQRHPISKETMDIYAPLANRLGIHAIKWELEDLAFHDLETDTYLQLAKQLNEKRHARQTRIALVIDTLQQALKREDAEAIVYGRAKHIYSIHRKMQRKNLPFEELYDIHAVRIITDSLSACYTALGVVHDLWPPITEEFDDYIATPKPNGYRSIHTAVIGPDEKFVEIQIRTQQMHDENELGGAAHWAYKEGSHTRGSTTQKIAWLRELLEWHKDVQHHEDPLDQFHEHVFEERVYVFTPNKDIIDLPQGATPLDFAYHIHSEVGHRCKGAKVNDKMVTLTHVLLTGDRVEVVTGKQAHPSRDWMNPESNYLVSPRARAKVLQWFKHQDADKNAALGRDMLDKLLHKLGATQVNLDKLANHLHIKSPEQLAIALACGNVRTSQIHHALAALNPQFKMPEKKQRSQLKSTVQSKHKNADIHIGGVSNLLTTIAKCCKPIPGEPIVGYITRGQGISIHHQDCNNIRHLLPHNQSRLMEVEWTQNIQGFYVVDLVIHCSEASTTADHLMQLLVTEKITPIEIKSLADRHPMVKASLQISDIQGLSKLIAKIKLFPGVNDVLRKNTLDETR